MHHLANWNTAGISFILTKPQGRDLCAECTWTISSRKVQLTERAATPLRKMGLGLGHYHAVWNSEGAGSPFKMLTLLVYVSHSTVRVSVCVYMLHINVGLLLQLSSLFCYS